MKFLSKKQKEENQNKETVIINNMQTNSEEQNNKKEAEIIPNPKIYLIDCSDDVYESLKDNHYSVDKGNLGQQIKLDFSKKQEILVRPEKNIAPNLHEYEIIIIDMKYNSGFIKIDSHMIESDNNLYVLETTPNHTFDPRPFSFEALRQTDMLPKKYILIVFAGCLYEEKYELVEMGRYGYNTLQTLNLDNYNVFDSNFHIGNKQGNEIKIEETFLKNTLEKYTYTYQVIFQHPWNWKGNEKVFSDSFLPLIRNKNDEIISYAYEESDVVTIVLPQTNEKNKLLNDLFKNDLPELFPDYFPYSTTFKWLKHSDYYLPNTKELLEEKEQLRKEYEAKYLEVESKIEKNNVEFKFLHEILFETGHDLVVAVTKYLGWLGYKNIKIMDEEENHKLEEDIQVENEKGLIIIEVKGIGGTSTDAECSQICKHRRSREKERNKFDVYPLYIVNHQRYQPPLSRNNPPFTVKQIQYAIDSGYGLVTTWELFQYYYMIEKGIITKQELMDMIIIPGLIPMIPDGMLFIGKIKEYFPKPNAFILDISELNIKVGDTLIFNKKEDWISSTIINLQVNDKDVAEASSGSIGVKVEATISEGYNVYIRKEVNTEKA